MNNIITQDTLWKGAFEDFAQSFLSFFLPQLAVAIDWSKEVKALDGELAQLYPEHATPKRRADKLLEVSLLNGQEQWVLIHAEAQGYRDPNFAKRMFQTFYRLRERYQKDLVSIVLYTNAYKHQHPSEYRYAYQGMELIYRFHAFSLVDYPPEVLTQIDNIFAIILEAAWYNLHDRKVNDELRFQQKMKLVNRIRKAKYSIEQIKNLTDFIKYYVKFQEPQNYSKLEKVLYQTSKPMGITEGILEQVSAHF